MVRRDTSPKRNVADPGSIPGASKGEVAELESSRWSFEEIQYLIDNYHIKTQAEIVLFLGRSHTSVSHKAARLGV